MMDRVVQYPHRYKAVPVAGQENVFDFVPVPGVVTAEGTALNKATLLSDETAGFLGLEGEATVNNALHRVNQSSFQAFCANANAQSISAAFGKGNESRMIGIGRQLAMYAWFMGETGAFSQLLFCDTLQECFQRAIIDILGSPSTLALINSSEYAKSGMYTAANVRAWKRSYPVMSNLINAPAAVDEIRTDFWDVWKEGWQTYTARGSASFTVPAGVNCITVEVIGAGANGGMGLRARGGNGGGYQLKSYAVMPGQVITGNIPAPGSNTTFADIAIATGTGAPGGAAFGSGGSGVGSTPEQSGKFLKVSTGGGNGSYDVDWGSGGGGGYGGGNGGDGGYAGRSAGPGGTGSGILPLSPGTGGSGGTGYNAIRPEFAGGNGDGGGGGGGGIGTVNNPYTDGGGGGGGYGGGGGAQGGIRNSSPSTSGSGGSGCIVIYM